MVCQDRKFRFLWEGRKNLVLTLLSGIFLFIFVVFSEQMNFKKACPYAPLCNAQWSIYECSFFLGFCGHGPIYPDSLRPEFLNVIQKLFFIRYNWNVIQCANTRQLLVINGKNKYLCVESLMILIRFSLIFHWFRR